MQKAVDIKEVRGRDLHIDGYNVLITTESLISGEDVFLCDDGFLRDMRGIFRRYRWSDATYDAIGLIVHTISEAKPQSALLLLDQQISRSGELAAEIRRAFSAANINGTAKTLRDVDRTLKNSPAVVATSDGIVIDRASSVLDIPAHIAIEKNIDLIRI